MDLAIFHFHLNRGGVTSVVVNHLLALARSHASFERALVLHGGRREGWPAYGGSHFGSLHVQTAVVEALEYDTLRPSAEDVERAERGLAGAILEALQQHQLAPDSTLFHFHNHGLGKNRALPGAIRQLAQAGYRLLLQVHDFAEDFRPAAYRRLKAALLTRGRPSLACQLYPQADNIHYAVLNRRDLETLEGLGVARSRVHWLPNPVEGLGELPDRSSARAKLDSSLPDTRPAVLYPVRGIRRKNLGEFLLRAALYRREATHVLSLAPKNPIERSSYERWKNRSLGWRLPVLWDSGGQGGLTFRENVAASDAMVTTSVAEGFGMVFLEAWLAGRPLVGRDLPEVTVDFKAEGIRLDTLHPGLRVPMAWLSRRQVVEPLQNALVDLCNAYDKPVPSKEEIADQLDKLLASDTVDFAMLAPDTQCVVIERVLGNDSAANHMRESNRLSLSLAAPDPSLYRDLIGHNQSVIEAKYDALALGKRLQETYRAVSDSSAVNVIRGPDREMAVVDRFLRLERLYPLRFET